MPWQSEFEQIQLLRDRDLGFEACLVIHNTRLGPAFGGIRRWAYGDQAEMLQDGLRLAAAMTWKCAVAGVPGGGGKVVMRQTGDLDRQAAYELLGSYVEAMGGRFYTGPDVGTDAQDLRSVARATRYVATPDSGAGPLAEPTALGVFSGIQAVASRLQQPMEGLRVAVQGLGEVGSRLARRLAGAGAQLVVADVRSGRAEAVAEELGTDGPPVEVADPHQVHTVECDVFAPCALGGVISDETLPQLRARAVAGAANNVLQAPAHGVELHRRGILYAPDFVMNAGALVHGALFHLHGQPPPPDRVQALGELVGELLDRSRVEQQPPEVLAEQLARQRVAEATSTTPFFPATTS